MGTMDERDVDPIEEMIRIEQSILKLESRGFQESYQSSTAGELIYDSEWCRINLIWDGWDPLAGNSMHIHYGRLHAPSEKATMLWNGEESRCWHRVEFPLHFLDKRTPTEAAELNYSHFLKTPFYEDDFRQRFNYHQLEWIAQIHITIWQYYGNQLFELFDLRQRDLWQQYRQFLKEVYDIKGRNPAIKPPLDKVC